MSDKKRQKTTIYSFFKPSHQSGDPGCTTIINDEIRASTSSNLNTETVLVATTATAQTAAVAPMERPGPANDIGFFCDSDESTKLTMEKRLDLLCNAWVPDADYIFSSRGKRNLRFQHQWLHRWKWLLYSHVQSGAFCKYCALFAPEGAGIGSQSLGKLVRVSFSNWTKAVEIFNDHEKTTYHKECIVSAGNLQSVAGRKVDSIDIQIDSASKTTIRENRLKVIPVIETVILCGRQGLPLRGHRDSGPLELSCAETSTNEGNFRALLRYRANGGDQVLSKHLQSSSSLSGYASYISPQIQNEIVDCCNLLIRDKLVNNINAAKCFSVLADETADISGTEQFSLCARYIDESAHLIREDFIQFVPVYDVTGQNLAHVIIDSLRNFGVNLDYLRGQGYDGAASMSGRFNGVQAHIARQFPLAPYVHCGAHSLNLAVSDACTEVAVRNCMGTISSTYNFLNTPKRQAVLANAVEENLPNARRKQLKQMCPTRWIERHDAVIVFLELFPAVVGSLKTISEWQDRESATNANQLLCAIKQPEFIITTHVVAKVFSISLPLCRFLQKENSDLAAAVNFATVVEDSIKAMRADSTNVFNDLYVTAEKTCEELDITILVPRTAKRQTKRCNVQTTDPEEYFRIAVFVPFVDHFLSQLQDRLLAHKQLLSGFMCLIPDGCTSKPSMAQQTQIKELLEKYACDLNCNDLTLLGEMDLWYRRVAAMDNPPKNALDALAKCDVDMFPAIRKLIKIMATLPVSTSSSERSFSTLRRLKTYLRNTIGQDRLNGLALMNIHRTIEVHPEDVLSHLARKPRRLNFLI